MYIIWWRYMKILCKKHINTLFVRYITENICNKFKIVYFCFMSETLYFLEQLLEILSNKKVRNKQRQQIHFY